MKNILYKIKKLKAINLTPCPLPLITLSLLLFLSSCANYQGFGKGNFKGYYKVGQPYQIEGQWYTPKEQPNYDETGQASWYGSDFHDKKTANGDTFDKNALTAAHKTLPLPSMVRVTNLDNNKTLIVMVNDRGPFSKGRILDVSERTAEILGFKKKGVANVRVQYLPGQTKRLLADLPGAPKQSGGLFAMGSKEPDDALTAPTDLDSPVPLSEKLNPFKKTPATAKNADTKKSTSLAKTDPIKTEKVQKLAIYEERKDSAAYPDAEHENPTQILESKLTPAKASLETIEEIKQEVHYIQAGTYGVMGNAKRAESKLAPIGSVTVSPVNVNGKTLYRVKVGPILNKQSAELALKKVITLGHPDAQLIKESGSL